MARAVAAAWLLAVGPALQAQTAVLPSQLAALPVGPQVVRGQATVATQGAAMTVRNTPGAILNWQSFSIGAANSVYFDQASAASKVLNRVTGQDPSHILGALGSNGQVWLLNPNGVLFGREARVDVAGLVASTLRLGDNDFLAGRYRFAGAAGSSAGVVNQGSLRSSFGGQIVLLGSRVENAGEIQTPGGQATLAAARSVELVDTGLPHLVVRAEVPAGEVLNLGRLAAAGGAVDIYGAIVNQQGLVQVDSLTQDAQGRIRLQAADTLLLGAASRTSAVGIEGTGGDITLLGTQVGLLGQAEVDASGAAGGGRIRVGGGFQGQDASLPNASRAGVAAGASLRADALQRGDGGEVVVWSDDGTRFQGRISARGGAAGGDGGFAEVSGKRVLDFSGSADLGAAAGRAGSLLLDPNFIVIQQGAPDISGNTPGVDLSTPSLLFADFPTSTSVITSGAVNTQLAAGNVVLQATQDITLAAGVTPINGPGLLTMEAGGSIVLQSAVTATGGLVLSANDPDALPPPAQPLGFVTVNAPLSAGNAALVITNNGGPALHLVSANLTAGTLAITGDVQLGAGSTWTLSGGPSTFSGALVGTSPFTKAGAGLLRLTGPNSHASTTVAAGTLSVSGAGATAGIGQIDVGAGTLQIDNGAVVGNTVVLAGGTIGNSAGFGTLSGAIALAGNANLAGVAAGGGGGLTVTGVIGEVSAPRSLTTTGTVTFTGNNTYTGGTTVAGGTLSLSGVGASAGSGTIDVGASALALNNGATASNAVTVSNGVIANVAGPGLLTGPIAVAGQLNLIGQGGGLTVAGVISGIGDLNKPFTGTVTLAGANAYSGSTTVGDGTLVTTAANRLPATTNVTVASGATLQLGGAETVASLALGGTLNGGTLTAASYALNGGTANASLGAGALTSTGTSSLSAPTAAATLDVNAGTLTLAAPNLLAAAPAVTLAAGATLALGGAESLGSLAGAGTLALGAATVATGSGASTTFSGTINGSGGLIKDGATTFSVNGTLAYTGATVVNAGTLNIDSAALLADLALNGGQLGGAGNVTVSGSFAAAGGSASLADGGTFTTQGSSLVAMSAAGGVLGVNKTWINSGTLTIADDDRIVLGLPAAGASTLNNAASGTLILASSAASPLGSAAGTTTVINAGNLLQTVAGTHSIDAGSFANSGGILVTTGTLAINAALAQTGLIDIAAGSTLQVPGDLSNNGTISGGGTVLLGAGTGTLTNLGTLSPGAAGGVGTLSVSGNVVLGAGTLLTDLGGTTPGTSDLLAVAGNVTLGGALDASIIGTGYIPANADFIPLVSAAGTSSGTFASLTLPAGFSPGYSLAAGEAARLIFATGPATKVFSNAAGNRDWATPSNWGGSLPGAADTALISGGFAVVHATGTDTIAELTIANANALDVSGGSLAVTGNTTLDGLLTVSNRGSAVLGGAVGGAGTATVTGGTLALNGPATFNTLNLVGGTLAGGGSLTVTNAFARNPAALLDTVFSGIDITQTTGDLVPGALAAGSVRLAVLDPVARLLVDSDVSSSTGTLSATSAGAIQLVPGGSLTALGDLALTARTLDLAGPLNGSRVQASGSAGVTFGAGATLVAGAAGDALVVNAGSGPFVNNAGAGALAVNAGARWLVWSGDPAADTVGGLAAAFRQYSASFGSTVPAAPGNGLLYSLAPTLTASLQGTVSKVYDAGTAATLAPANFTVAGALAADTVVLATPSVGSFDTRNVGAGKTVSASTIAATATDSASGIPVFGYQFSGNASGAIGSITAAPLTVTGIAAAGKVYDGTAAATLASPGSVTPLATDAVTLTGGTASFADKNAGAAKPVTVAGLALSGADAGNYTLVGLGPLAASITALPLTVAGVTAANKVYDAGTAATLAGTAAVAPLAGDSVTLAGAASASFADKNVGVAKPVAVSGFSLTGVDAGNYSLQQPAGLAAAITAAPLAVSGLSAASRVYDGSTAAALAGSATIAPLAGDTVALAGAASGSFADANVGAAKPVTLAGLTLAGTDAANYTLSAAGPTGAITPATLAYVAAPANATAGLPLPALAGTVSGFVAGDSLAASTSGTLAWTTPATPASLPGSYAIDGGGLAALNYAFVQAPGNASALTLAAAPPTTSQTSPTVATLNVLASSLPSVQVALAMSSPTSGRVLDATPAFLAAGESGSAGGGGAGGGSVFGAINFSQLPRADVQTLLAARAGYKKKVLAGGVYKLEQDPSLADVRPCRNEAELSTGSCLITEQLKQEIEVIAARAAAARAANGAAPQAKARKAGQRKVKVAALPRIERKLALLIGVNRYADKNVPQLEGAVPDVRAVREMLERRLGYETVVLEDPGREAIVRAFNKLALEADNDDSVIVYYAGHGVVVPINGVDTGFWLPSDVDAGLPQTWLANADIARMVAAIGSRQLMLVSDSCYSGSLAGNEKVQLDARTDVADFLQRRAAVVMSSGGNEPVADEGRDGHSVFAWHLMKVLGDLENWQPGVNLFERVRAGVVKDFPQTPQYGASRAAGHQGQTDYVFERRELDAASPGP
ncbi:YDG domain-containing protein [Rubrivivax sp. A210]|uniref:YDG domain-containing protein n=1 Tax=Rubrivivax sp. A210 TaxID=2772301 RepID=UPI0019183A7D|nr:YDG domain-containing protein [Rubrivivax sp. A210]